MSEEFEFVSVEDAIDLHASVMGAKSDDAWTNVMSVGLLESALNRPRLLCFYEGADLPALAATLLWGVVMNHAFYDGNKRTAWVVTQFFVHQNGFALPPSSESTRLVLNIALGRRNVVQVEEWIRQRLAPESLRPLFW